MCESYIDLSIYNLRLKFELIENKIVIAVPGYSESTCSVADTEPDSDKVLQA